MNIIAVNGSPRKNWNTGTLLQKSLEGAASKGAKTKLIHLHDFQYKGCQSCFSCKLLNSKNMGKCSMKDDITTVLDEVTEYDGFILGSPIYFGSTTGAMRSFLERLVYPYHVYDGKSTRFPKRINTGVIYTMNIDEATLQDDRFGLKKNIQYTESLLTRVFGYSEALLVFDTYQFNDYS